MPTTMSGHSSRSAATTWISPEVTAEFESAGLWGPETWVDLVVAQASSAPHAIAVVDEEGQLTRGEAMSAAKRVAAYLWHRGVRPGDVITLVLPNWREFVVIHTAVGLLGCVVSPLLPKLGVDEMRHVLRTSASRFVFAARNHRNGSPWEHAVRAAEDADSVIDVVPVRSDSPDSLEAILIEPWEDRVALPMTTVQGADWDTVTFTSGTESLPKGVVHSHRSTMYGLRAYIGEVLGLHEGDIVFMPSPLCHASGIEWGLRTAIYVGAPLILQDRWDPEVALHLIERYGCTYTLAATPFISDLVAAKRRGIAGGATMRYFASGGTTIPRHLPRDVRDVFTADLMGVFGSSETYVSTATRPGYSDALLATEGVSLPGVQIRIVDESGTDVPPGEVGEIVTRGPQVFVGYLGDPALTLESFFGDWYRFGDLGQIGPDGMLRVTGRIKDIVIRGGENISVREIEDLLIGHPGVESVAVVAYPHERLGEICCAVVMPAAGASLELSDLTAYLLELGLPKFKLPERLQIVNEMPMTATGKIRKAELRESFVRGAE